MPAPGETVLIAAAVYAGAGQLNIALVVLIGFLAAVAGLAISQRLLTYFPVSNTTGTQNYIANVRSSDSDDTALIRLDHKLGERDQLSFVRHKERVEAEDLACGLHIFADQHLS